MTRHISLLLQTGFNTTTLAAAVDGFFVANWLSGQALYDWRLLSTEGGSVASFGGLPTTTEALRNQAPRDCDSVLILSSFDPYGLADHPATAGFLREAYRFGARICGLETGGVAMARAGLLDGKQAAIHWANRDGFAERFPLVQMTEAPVHRDGRCLTGAGGAAALDLILLLIEEDTGHALARDVAAHLLRPWGVGGSASNRYPSPSPDRDELVETARAMMAEWIDEPMGLEDIAAGLGLSLRSLERRFAKAVGMSPRDYYLTLRLTRAQNLLQQTRMAVGDVAAETGFQTPQSFCRAYKTRFGLSPGQDRRQVESASVPKVL